MSLSRRIAVPAIAFLALMLLAACNLPFASSEGERTPTVSVGPSPTAGNASEPQAVPTSTVEVTPTESASAGPPTAAPAELGEVSELAPLAAGMDH